MQPMAKNPRPRKSDFGVYLAVRCVVCLVQALPPGWARKLACGLAWLAYRVDRRHREVAADNLRHAFPEWADYTPNSIWIYDTTHFTRAKMAVLIIQDLVSRKWIDTMLAGAF